MFAAGETQIVSAELETGGKVNIVNITTVLDCFDAQHSMFTTHIDNLDRDTAQFVEPYQRISMVTGVVLRRMKVDGHGAFRVRGWSRPLIASDVIVNVLRRMGVTGFITAPVELSD